MTAIATAAGPLTDLDHLLDSIRAAARSGSHAQLTLHGDSGAMALREWASRHGYNVTTERFSRNEAGARVRWACDRVDLSSRSWIAAHWDDEPAAGGIQ